MTDLNKLLYVAEKVWPDGEWYIVECGRKKIRGFMCDEEGNSIAVRLEPHKPTERGRAQLTDIEDAIIDVVGDIVIGKDDKGFMLGCNSDGHQVLSEGKTKAEAIINLATEVL